MHCFVGVSKYPAMVGLEFMNLQNSKILPQINKLKVVLSLLPQLLLNVNDSQGLVNKDPSKYKSRKD